MAKTPAKKVAAPSETSKYFIEKKYDAAREERIEMEYVADADDSAEREVGWHCSLEDAFYGGNVKVLCRCYRKRAMSPLAVGDEVEVFDIAPQEECRGDMFGFVMHNGKKLAVPLNQLQPLKGNNEAMTIIEDWNYWCIMDYAF